jgi:hypothetical protein
MPIKRKGREISQINGQRISAINANGQQAINSNNQQINVSMRAPVLKNMEICLLDTVSASLDSHTVVIYLQTVI